MLHGRSWVVAALAGVLASCSSDSTGPTELGEFYELRSADDAALPVSSFRTVSNAAGSCVYDLTDGSVTFSEFGHYGLHFGFNVRCLGRPDARVHDITDGRYTRSGDSLTLTPDVLGTFTVVSARIDSDGLTLRTRTNAGEEHTYRFRERRF